MDLSIISPPKCLELSDLVRPGFGMVLPEGIILSPDYVRFYREFEGYTILDNGIVEGRQFTGVELHHMAYEVGAQCVVVPDQFRDADTTIRLARDFERHRNPELDYMGVLQGLDLADVLSCLNYYNTQEWITHIGLPRILCEFHKMQRTILVQMIRREQEKGNYRDFKIHALGGSPWLREVIALADIGCDSMDTSLPVVLGLEGFGLDHEYISRKPDFMEQDVDRNSLRWRILLDNCATFHSWASNGARAS
jgi:hypothetical protein